MVIVASRVGSLVFLDYKYKKKAGRPQGAAKKKQVFHKKSGSRPYVLSSVLSLLSVQ